jgi:eukaryotic-like serine/threonine-protein kinase
VTRLTAALADRYRLERELGQGGMATVYLAEDLKHQRKVAIKVLHPELSAVIGGERFLAEIRTTAQLQHPHILGLIDSGEADRLLYYVMPYVSGESLRARLERDKQLPVEDALRLAREVAGALDYAHRQGVVHRDIKPENILLQDGSALVADFGIALAVQQAGGSRMTQTGMSLGTPHYMAPEQAMGERDITPRADVYALGAVTYEMLAGEPPFTGPNSQAIVAKVLTEPAALLRPKRATVAPHVEAAILTALQKLPADRFASAALFADALARPGASGTYSATVALPAATRPRARIAGALPWLAAVAGLGLAAAAWLSRPAPLATRWHYLSLGDGPGVAPDAPSLALSPDGTMLVFAAVEQAGRLWLKRAGELDATPVPGTESGYYPTFSPDGQWIAFTASGRVKKVRPDGTGLATLADSALIGFGGVAWLDDGTIVFVGPERYELSRVSAAGGARTTVLADSSFRGLGTGNVVPLPGSRGVVFVVCNSGCAIAELHALDLRTGARRKLLDDALGGWVLPDGRLLYIQRDGTVRAAPFDADRLELAGAGVAVLEKVAVSSIGAFAGSASGTIAYLRGADSATAVQPVRVGRDGVVQPIDSNWTGPFSAIAVAPDGRRVAVGAGRAQGALSVWTKQLPAGPFTRLTFGGNDRRPVWSRDGRTVAFVHDTSNGGGIWARPVDGSREAYRLTPASIWAQAADWSPDGKWLVVRTDNGGPTRGDIVGIRVGGDTTPVPLVATPFAELHPAISPDGRWLAYTSDESGVNEVFVRPFPETQSARWQVSTGSGLQPRWSSDGSRLYYGESSGWLVEAVLRTTSGLEVVERNRLFSTTPFFVEPFHHSYDVWPRDSGFVFLRTGRAVAASLVVAEHWFTELDARTRK